MLASSRIVPSAPFALTLALAACGPSPDAVRSTATANSVKSATSVSQPEGSAAEAKGPQFTADTRRSGSTAPDPSWFSPALLPTATVKKKGRTAVDDEGRFTSQLLFELPTEASLSDCVEPLSAALVKIVPAVKREEKDGRVTLTGETSDQQVIFMCGEVEGRVTAFVSYRWTAPPPTP